jgi:pyruvate dehydrogenase E2 component (dihydrolipoamide acetyltransferase)
MSDFVMPSLGADMESATVTEWLVKPGIKVKKGDVVAVVETHKGAIEVEIFQEGVVSELCAKEGEVVPVGALLARIAAPGEAPKPAPPAVSATPAKVAPTRPVEAAPPSAPEPAPARMAALAPPAPTPPGVEAVRAKVTPAARRRAAELGIDPAALAGTGIEGSVTLADVELAAASAKPAPPVAPAVEAPRKARPGFDPAEMRKAIAIAMGRSKREIPHYYLSTTIDVGRALDWLVKFNEKRGPEERVLPAVLLLKASSLALREVPQLNGFWVENGFRPGPGIHIGWAISLRGGGLVAPAVHDADQKTIVELMAAVRDLIGRARSGGLRSSELTDPTITVTSLGDRGAESVIGVIYPPQVAIIGFGRIAERPWVADGRVKKRPLVSASLAADHRASDGHVGGLLLSAIERLLQEPDKL